MRRAAVGVRALALVLAVAAHADGPKRLAVLEFELAPGIQIDRTYFSDLARGVVKKAAPQLFVMTRESTESLLQANNKTMADCTGECEIEVGRKLGADYVVSGRITKVGTRQILTVRLFSTADGALLGDEEADGRTEDQLVDEAKIAVGNLIKPLSAPAGDPSPASPAAPGGTNPAAGANMAAPASSTPPALAKATTEPAAPPPTAGAFDRGDAAARLSAIDVQECQRPDGPTGPGHVKLALSPSGSVQSAVIDQPPFADTEVGRCIAAKFRAVRLSPFLGEAITVGKAFKIKAASPGNSQDGVVGGTLPRAAVEAAQTMVEPKSGLEFVPLPGSILIGGNFAGTRVAPFSLGRTATTVVAYGKCIAAGACTEPRTYYSCNWKTGRDNHPINCVDWAQATAFCRWIGGRLPTSEEREWAASGGESRDYPWGSQGPGNQLCWSGEGSDLGKDNHRRTTCPVGAYPTGRSKQGLLDLAGNVWEWLDTDSDRGREIRGGSWGGGAPGHFRASYRGWYGSSAEDGNVGFRCAL